MAGILFVFATEKEASVLTRSKISKGKPATIGSIGNQSIDVLVTGPGIMATTFHLTRAVQSGQYIAAINLGICGSADKSVRPVTLVRIISDRPGDFGAENGSSFLDATEIGLLKPNDFPFRKNELKPSWNVNLECLKAIPSRKGITVQKVHGSRNAFNSVNSQFGNVMESMEGMAFFYCCMQYKIPCLQVRAVSNMVEKRNKSSWKIKEALDALEGFTGLLLMELTTKIN